MSLFALDRLVGRSILRNSRRRMPWHLIAVALAATGCLEMSPTAASGAAPEAVLTADLGTTEALTSASPAACGRTPPCCPGFIEGPSGGCVQQVVVKTTNLRAQYYLLSLIYVPPGKGSSVTYQDGIGISHKVDISRSLATSVGVTLGPPAAQTSATFSITDINGFSYQVKNNAVSQESVSAFGRSNDEIPPDDDIFVIAFGPLVRVTQTTIGLNPTTTTIYAPDFSNAAYVSVTAGELKNPALMDPFTHSLFADATPADYAKLLAFDPRAVGGDVGDPQRYTYVRNMALQGLLPPAYDNISTNTQTYSHNETTDNTSGYKLDLSVKTDVGLSKVFKVQQQISFSYSNTVTDGSDTSRSASVTLATTTRDCTANYAVYYDSLFNTLAFKKLGGAPACQ
jgi:hypothetical protein